MTDWLKDLEKVKPEPKSFAELQALDRIHTKPNIMYEVATSRLKPGEMLDIDFNRIANLSSFQRFFIEAIKQVFPNVFKSVDPRASKEKTAEQFNKRKAFMKDCMTEFKGLLEKEGGE